MNRFDMLEKLLGYFTADRLLGIMVRAMSDDEMKELYDFIWDAYGLDEGEEKKNGV